MILMGRFGKFAVLCASPINGDKTQPNDAAIKHSRRFHFFIAFPFKKMFKVM
jgi:hypothetical protein